jgi:hypothetical protein
LCKAAAFVGDLFSLSVLVCGIMSHQKESEPTLPTGEVIDSKNTLQSFDAPDTLAAGPPAVAPEFPAHPTLPDGAVITGKNTLQSFDERLPDGLPNPIDTVTPPPPATVLAVAVDADVVYAEIAPTAVLWYKSRSSYLLLFVAAVSLALGLGLYIGRAANDPPMDHIPPLDSVSGKPTSAPVVVDPNLAIRAAVLTSYINNITLSNQAIQANGTSPESKALAWLVNNDTALDTAAVISKNDPIAKNAVGFRIRQRYPLLVMWFQQNATTKWDNDAEWLVNPNECYWFGISCKPLYVFFDNGFNQGSQNAVTQVTFNLIGSYVGIIPYDIGLLTTMEHFEIKNTLFLNNANGRYLQGSLPDSIGQWNDLTYFDVSGNALTGTLPNSIGQWTALTYFNASNNFGLAETYLPALGGTLPGLKGTLPDSIGYWTALTYFDISSNDFFGTLPNSIGQWTALTYFDAFNNGLSGTIPSSIGNWSLIERLDLAYNLFEGSVPSAICQYINPDTRNLVLDCRVICSCCTFGSCIGE